MKPCIKIISTPIKGGVRDYANLLNKIFIKKGIKCQNLYLTKKNRFKIRKYIKQNDLIIFQYEAYGYQKKGLPLWLIYELKILKSMSKRLGIFVHEIFAEYNILSPKRVITIIQKYIAKKLIGMSDFCITNNEIYFRWIKNNCVSKINHKCSTVSIFKNNQKNSIKNLNKVVIFGTEASRIKVYKNNIFDLISWKKKNKLKFYDVGPIANKRSYIFELKKKINIVVKGKLNNKKISNLFSNANLGILNCENKLILKSSIFATYSIFKICPINVFDNNFKKKNKTLNYFLNHFPDVIKDKKKINNIRYKNFLYSKKNNINKHINVYLKYLN